MKRLMVFAVFALFVSSLLSQEAIREEVNVDWWVIPLFAIDQQGKSVNDLVAGDFHLSVNGKKISDFSFFKRNFSVDEKVQQKKLLARLEKRRMIFFLFDLAFSSLQNMERSKKVAENIVSDASDSCLFSVFTIDPFAGLIYQIGPTSRKADVMNVIKSKAILNINAKSIKTIFDLVGKAQIDGVQGDKYDPEEMEFFLEDKTHSLKNTNRKFFGSFEALYYALNSIEDNKFVYFFSEGVSLFARKIIRHDDEEYLGQIRQTADYLSRSGAVLFVINPAGALESFSSPGSGEDSLRQLALDSGGKYMEGETKTISDQIHNLHRAYYEIAFPEKADYRGSVRKIDLVSTREGVSIHTLHVLEKSKSYLDMNNIEREIFALNLINRNPFFEKKVIPEKVIINDAQRLVDKEMVNIRLPENWVENEIDLFKVWIEDGTGEVTIEKKRMVPRQAELRIELEVKSNWKHYFTLINPRINSAMVQGVAQQEIEIPDFNKIPEIKAMSDEFKISPELETLLVGSANYCEKLKQAGFHYFCREKVVETFNIFYQDQEDDISSYEDRASESDMLERNRPRLGFQRRMVNKYIFDYQIIKDQSGIKEQRKLISSKKGKKGDGNSGLELQAFLSEKAVFSPFTLLARERQPLYEYRFVGNDKLAGQACAVIEALPRNQEDAQFVYGQVWIDSQDYSILKIKANPRSISGYNQLQYIAKKLGSKLFLDLDIGFGVIHNGLRFPDKVILSELYKGGRLVYRDNRGRLSTRRIGPKGWERNRTEYTYSKYKFFNVDVQVSEQN
jgi:hypothetical protein